MKPSYKSYARALRALWLAFTVLVVCACLMLPTLAAKNEENTIASIRLNKGKTDLAFEITLTEEFVKEHKSEKLALFEYLPYQSTSETDGIEPIKTFSPAEKVSFKVPFTVGNMNRLYSKFVVAKQEADGSYTLLTSAKYVDNVTMLAENTEKYPTGSSKKGLQIQMFEDAQLLGVQHTVVNVPINEYMLGANSNEAMSFVYNGQTFYVDKAKIALLDHRVKTYTEAGITVYFNIILTAPDEAAHENIRALYFEDISPDAALYALNTRSETAMRHFQAFMDYMCARYTRADHLYGFVPAVILGFEVNSGRIWNNAGSFDTANYVYSYVTAFRTTYIAMTSHYSEGRVYLSLGNNFGTSSYDTSNDLDVKQDFPAKRFLEVFSETIKQSGDIPWGLSINPYASDPSLTEYWTDPYATDNYDTPFITMKNIDVLTDFLSEEAFLYKGDVRSVIIGEFGVSGSSNDHVSMTKQAAAFALAYYTAAQNEHIDAFIYHRHVDHSGESQYYGLWSNAFNTIVEPESKKTIYNVFQKIDTAESEEVTAFVRQTVGNGAWGLFMDSKVNFKAFDRRTVYASLSANASDFEKGYEERMLFDLTSGKLLDFYPSDNVEYVELRPSSTGVETMLFAKAVGTPREYMGISNTVQVENSLKDAHYITLRIKADAPVGTESMQLMLRLQSKDGERTVVFEGETLLKPGEWQDVSFRIRDFTKATGGSINLMKLWMRTADAKPYDGEYGIWLESVTLQTKGGLSVFGVILVILLSLIGLAVLVYGALFVRAQIIRTQRRKERAAEMARRREQLRMQAMHQTQNGSQPYGRLRDHQTQSIQRYRSDDF